MDETIRSEAGESRWPMAGAVAAVIVLTYLLPAQVRVVSFGDVRVAPILEAVLLAALIIGDPGRIDRRTTALHRLATALVLVMLGGALVQTVALTVDLIKGGGVTDSGRLLLEAGSIVWVVNNISFALLYWQLDGGGAPARVHHVAPHADFAFPQQLAPELAPSGWMPGFFDYFYLGFTNAIAFSPADVLPLTVRAKVPMLVQSLVSLALVGLVIARAVNVLPG